MMNIFFFSLFVLLLWSNEIKQYYSYRLTLRFSEEEEAIKLLDYVISYTSAGFHMTEALTDFESRGDIVKEIKSAIHGKPENALFYVKYRIVGLLLKVFRKSLSLGIPCNSLSVRLRNFLRNYYNFKLTSNAVSAQGKVQAIVMFFIPVFVAIAISFIWPELLINAWNFKPSMFLVLGALTMEAIGALRVKKLVCVDSFSYNFEFSLFLMIFSSNLESGSDIVSSLKSSFHSVKLENKQLVQDIQSMINKIENHEEIKFNNINVNFDSFWRLIVNSLKMGNSVNDQVTFIIENLYVEENIRLEKFKQLLPMKILVPLFVFFLPAMLMLLGALLIPQLIVGM